MGRGGDPGLVDDLGIEWVFEPTAGGSIVHPEKPQLMNDIEWLYDNYVDKIVFAVWPEETTEEVNAMSEEEQRECARRFVERFNKPGKPSLLSLFAPNAPRVPGRGLRALPQDLGRAVIVYTK